jgi:hypothetical protein
MKSGQQMWLTTLLHTRKGRVTVEVPVEFIGKTTKGYVVIAHIDGRVETLDSAKGLSLK